MCLHKLDAAAVLSVALAATRFAAANEPSPTSASADSSGAARSRVNSAPKLFNSILVNYLSHLLGSTVE